MKLSVDQMFDLVMEKMLREIHIDYIYKEEQILASWEIVKKSLNSKDSIKIR
ncbi:hypothetical protein [Paenibacillus psychroresistens]|uniref:hypothetical protein n=1 Tax=Paenibacillus psychroresistens TaxID=1778678 RepID=UPI0012DA342A|nr:hypothetical protein [Paenibacillus psychroresistens]